MSELFSLKSDKGFYQKIGEGNSVVLLHGFAETFEIWNNIYPKLSTKYQIIIPQIPACGNSETLEENFSMEAIADFVYEILKQEEIDSTILFGHSMGGYAAMAFAEKYPERLAKLSLVHSTAEADSKDKKQVRQTAINFIKENGKEGFLKSLIPKLYADIDTVDPELIAKHKEMAAAYTEAQLIDCYQAMKNRKDRTHILSEINIPVQFIAGKKDLSIAFENIIQQSKKCNTADLCFFEDIGHTSMHENPKILLEAIIGFIDDKFPHSKS